MNYRFRRHVICILLSVLLTASSFTPLALTQLTGVGRLTKESALYAAPVGPLARAKKLMDPAEYDRVVREKMKKSGMSREEAEDDYNSFLENPPFYYALEKKEEYYKKMGYKDIFEGMIAEAEKEGKGDEMRERLAKFRLRSRIKAASVLIVAIVAVLWVQTIYEADPEHFMKGGLPDYSARR